MKPISPNAPGLISRLKKSVNGFDTSYMKSFDAYDAPLVGQGGSGAVLAIDDRLVIKYYADGDRATMDFERELRIYERLQGSELSPNVVQFKYQWDHGIVMERLGMTLRQRLHLKDVTVELKDRWISETTQGLAFLHSKGILHGDFGCQNIMIDGNGHAKLCDFAGSKLDDQNAWICYEVRSQHPGYRGKQPTTVTELFSLGSVIFEISTTRPPYETLTNATVRKKYEEGNFPLDTVDRPRIRRITEKCWKDKYKKVAEVCEELQETREKNG